MKIKLRLLVLAGLITLCSCAHVQSQKAGVTKGPDKNFYIFLCFGQSNMEGFPGIPQQDKTNVDNRFQLLAAVDFPGMDRKKDNWYTAVPPLCRPGCGLCPADYFGRTLVANLPKNIKVGVINVAVAGCKIELFDKINYNLRCQRRPLTNKTIIKLYGGNPYQRLVDMGKLAQKDGVIKGILLHQGESNNGDKAMAEQGQRHLWQSAPRPEPQSRERAPARRRIGGQGPRRRVRRDEHDH